VLLLRFIQAASKNRSATRAKDFVMSDPNQHPQAKLKELIERASIAAAINFKKGN
jgi:hypothetical protein